MSEKIEKRITEIENKLLDINVEIYLVDRRLWFLRSDIHKEGARKASFTRWYREYEKRGLVDRAEEELKKLVDTERVYEALKDVRSDKHDERDVLLTEKEELEEELERLKRKIIPPVIPPEFIDINEEDGYLIYYSNVKKKYFKVHPDEYEDKKGNIIEGDREIYYFESLQICTVFSFDTSAANKYPDMPARTLEAECRICVNVREAGKRLSDVIPVKLKVAFERHCTLFFEAGYDRGKGAGTWKGGQTHIIAKGVDYKGNHDIEVSEVIKDILGVKVLKVGVFYRISDENPNMIIEEEYCRAKVTGEWSRQNYSESISREFDVEEQLSQPLHWNMLRGFVGETGFEQLKRIKKEEEK